jgi:hypothetical protein
VLENCPSIGLLLSYMKIFSPTASLITKTVALRLQLKAAVFWCVQVFNKCRAWPKHFDVPLSNCPLRGTVSRIR